MTKNLLDTNVKMKQKFYFQFLFYLGLVILSISFNYFSGRKIIRATY